MHKEISKALALIMAGLLAGPTMLGGGLGQVQALTGKGPGTLTGKRSPINKNYIPNTQEWREKTNQKEDKRYGKGFRQGPTSYNTNYEAFERAGIFARLGEGELPAKFDWRDVAGKLPPVRNQGASGSCWSFATYASGESKNLPKIPDDYSEQNLRNTHRFNWGPDDGGNAYISAAMLANRQGPVFETDDPYREYVGVSPRIEAKKDLKQMMFLPDIRNPKDLQGELDVEVIDILKRQIQANGAMYTTLCGTEDRPFFNKEHWALYIPYDNKDDRYQQNHAVAIVGWDDNFSKENFVEGNQPPTDGAWIIRNSWSSGWGDHGYYYVSYWDRNVGHQNAFYELEDLREGKLWSYDELGWVGSYTLGDLEKDGEKCETGWFANVFGPAEEDLVLDEIGFYAPSNDANVEISVDVDDKKDGKFTNIQEIGQADYEFAGYYRYKFPEPVRVRKGEYFTPIVKIHTPGYPYPIALEYPASGYSSRAVASEGESFVSMDGRTWEDLTGIPDDVWDGGVYYSYTTKNSNVCLKAFTKNIPVTEAELILQQDEAKGLSEGEFLAGSPINYQINLLKSDGQPASYEAVTMSLVHKDGREVSDWIDQDCKTNFQGRCMGSFVVSKPGEYQVIVKNDYKTLATKDLVAKDSKLEVKFEPTSTPYSVGETIILRAQLFSNGKAKPYTSFDAYVKDPEGNVLQEGNPYQVTTNFSGNALLKFKSEKIGTYTIECTPHGQQETIIGTDTVIVGGESSIMIFKPESGFEIGKKAYIRLQVFKKGQPHGYAKITVMLKDGNGKTLPEWDSKVVNTNFNGQALVQFTPQEAGEYTLTILGPDDFDEVLAKETFKVLGQ